MMRVFKYSFNFLLEFIPYGAGTLIFSFVFQLISAIPIGLLGLDITIYPLYISLVFGLFYSVIRCHETVRIRMQEDYC